MQQLNHIVKNRRVEMGKNNQIPASKSAEDLATRNTVWNQLTGRFPHKAIDWVKTVPWSGPTSIPLTDIDTDDIDSWAASHDPEGLAKEQRHIKDNIAHPIVLVKPQNSDKYIIVDGHHRFLAYKSLGGTSAPSWVASVPSAQGPWAETHLSQKGGDSA